MDFKPVCLRVTFCNIKLLVTVSPFKAIVDLKKEVSRVYHLHYPQKTEECKYIQDDSGYLVCDDYQVGLVFNNYDSVFALTASQPLDKYSDQWKSSDSSAKLSGADEQQCVISRQPHTVLVSNKNPSKATSTPVSVEGRKHLDEESDEASETDCSNELIPQVLEGNQLAHVPKPSVDPKQVNSPIVTAKNKKELSKKESTGVFTDSSLSDSDSETVTSKTTMPTRAGGKTIGEEPKLTPKKKTRKTVQEQSVVTSTGSGDKMKDSVETRKSLGQKFQLAIDSNNTPPATLTVTKKLRTKRKHSSDDAQGTSSEKKAKKKISKKELELANTSSQSMILDNAKLWTE